MPNLPELQRLQIIGSLLIVFDLYNTRQLDFTTELIRQLADLDVHADVPLVLKKTCVHNAFYYPCYDQGKIFYFLKTVTKRDRKSRKQMSNVWVVRLTCVSRMKETICSVFRSVSVIHCNVCAYVAMLEHYEIHL